MAPLFSLLKGIYYGGTPGALRGPRALYEQARRLRLKGLTLEKVKQFLASQPIYTRHRPARRNYKRNPIDANFPGNIVQVDIWDMQRLETSNATLYILLAYDTFSKFLSGVPLLNRKPASVEAGLKRLIDASPFPWAAIYWDKEGAFLSRQIQGFLKDRNVHNYTTKSLVKAPGVERVIRTLRSLLQRRLEAQGHLGWESELPKLIANYNKREHSTTGLAPRALAANPVLIADSPKELRRRGKKRQGSPPPPPPAPARKRRGRKLPAVGAYVRLNRLRGRFEKEASDTWTEEVFRVARHKKETESQPIPMIYVEDLHGEGILGALFPEEYQEVTWSGRREPERVVEERNTSGGGGRRPRREFLVSYRGWPPKFNTWVKTRPRGL
jgi:hypothetical protein